MAGSTGADLASQVEAAIARGQGPQHLAALDSAIREPAKPISDRAALLLLRCRVHRQAVHFPQMLEDAVAAADLYASLDDRPAEARAVAMAAIAAAECGEMLAAVDLAVRARVTGDRPADRIPDPWVLNRLGIFSHQVFDIRSAVQWWRAGLSAARTAGDDTTEILLVHNVVEASYTACRLGDLEGREAVAALDEAEDGARWLAGYEAGTRRMPVDGPRLLAQVLAAAGRVTEALVVLDAGRGDLQPRTSTLVRSSWHAAEGYCLLSAGRPEAALKHLEQALAPHRGDSVDVETLLARQDRADALERLGRHAEALVESRRATAALVARLREQGRGVLREVDLRVVHELERSRLLREADSLAEDAQRDPLTRAGNRRRLTALAAELVGRAGVGAVVVDLDRFKQVNDRYGHAVGDRVIVAAVAALEGCCRTGDEVVRLGGEEFLLICPDVDASVAAEVGERVRVALERHDWDRVVPGLRVTASVGSATGPGSDLEATIARADAALLLAKHEGRNRSRSAHTPRVVLPDGQDLSMVS